MSLFDNLVIIFCLIGTSCFFSMSEIALAASRKIRLRQMAEEGDLRAEKVLALQTTPGSFFTVVQIGLNAVAIMGGIVGESAFTPYFAAALAHVIPQAWVGQLSFVLSFVLVTSLFILIADLMPKRVAMALPEKVAVNLVNPMLICITLLRPFVWIFNGMANGIFKLLQIPTARNDEITPDDIYAIMDAGAEAGVLDKGEQQMIENVFEMQSVSVTSAMTARESLVYFLLQDDEDTIKKKIAEDPHNKFLVCDGQLDNIKGVVDAKELLIRVINGRKIDLKDTSLVRSSLIIPDTLSLSEAMEYFRHHRADFAVVMNEYALVVGIVTTDDLQSAVMGAWSLHESEEQIVPRDANSWLVDGVTPITDVMRAFGIEEFPQNQNYETIAGFMMYTLRKIPKRTDSVNYAGYKFEVVDIDAYKVDQLLVTRLLPQEDQLPKDEESLDI
ncbi:MULTISPECIES: hemolysin family protein [Shewanella]|uniref:Polyamine export protein n=3 Tax=Bacteria TaxID=2 RepID=A0A2T3H0D0_9GAMM|nr:MULTISPECIES: hemolysin family protein [Shewanella]AYV15431.1 HlyC/CorC family transporter [Shewanella algae]EKT4488459.1 HlyC/CorC family transporter [Shewanella algae]MBO2549946.1 HlyC/CorC family transporter [Shewanella algae]MBO2554261.1 HlyC/CorC family transporter [Shewanella algae]MBO2558507.1 HlyC/CorC family transporter [Shewanella algae]